MNHSIRPYFIFILSLLLVFGQADAFAQKKNKKRHKVSQKELIEAEELFTEGVKYDILENYEKALSLFERSAEILPDNAATFFKIAETKAKLNKVAEAIPDAEKALELDESNAYYYTLVAQLYEKQNKYNEALKVYQRLVKKVPRSEEYLYAIAACYLNLQKPDEAIKAYDKIEKLYGINPDVVRQKQHIYLKMNKLDDAISEGKKLVEAFPEESTYLVNLAEMLASNNKIQEALPLLNLSLQKDPQNPYARLVLSDIYKIQGNTADANRQLELAFKNTELNIDDKVKILARYLKGFANEEEKKHVLQMAALVVEAHPDDPKSYALQGDFLHLSEQKKEARNSYLQSIRLDNTKYAVWEQVIRIDLDLNQIDSVAKHTDAAVELFPNQGTIWFYNGLAHLMGKNTQKGVKALERSKKLAVNNPKMLSEINAQLGDAYHNLKEYKKSDEAYEAVLNMDESNIHVLNNYSYYLSLRKEKLDLAKKMGEKLITLKPNESTYLDTYGWVLYMAKEYKEAAKYLEQAAKDSTNGTIIEHYGDVLYQLGDKENALLQWKKAKQLGGELTEHIDKKIANKKLYE